jgi:hypothetical protein
VGAPPLCCAPYLRLLPVHVVHRALIGCHQVSLFRFLALGLVLACTGLPERSQRRSTNAQLAVVHSLQSLSFTPFTSFSPASHQKGGGCALHHPQSRYQGGTSRRGGADAQGALHSAAQARAAWADGDFNADRGFGFAGASISPLGPLERGARAGPNNGVDAAALRAPLLCINQTNRNWTSCGGGEGADEAANRHLLIPSRVVAKGVQLRLLWQAAGGDDSPNHKRHRRMCSST